MPKYNPYTYRYFYHSIYYYLNHPYGVKRKVLKILKPNIRMCTGLSYCAPSFLQGGRRELKLLAKFQKEGGGGGG